MQVIVAERVAFLMLGEPGPINLETVIGQMDQVAGVAEVVFSRASPQVALSVDVDLEVPRHKRPNSYIKFSAVIE